MHHPRNHCEEPYTVQSNSSQQLLCKVLFILEFAFSLCRGEIEKWVDPLLISLLGLCFGGNRQRLLRHFRRLKHEPVREKATKIVFAGVFAQIESILFSSENRYRDSEPHYFRAVFSLYATRNKAPKICWTFLFSLGYISLLTFLRVVSQFSPGLPFAVDRSLRESLTRFFHGQRCFQFQTPQF